LKGEGIMTETTIKVEGMSCQHCVMRVKKAVDALKGIQSSDVQIGTVKVKFDEKEVLKADIEKAIATSGYKVVSSS
jgi:copper chaperone